VQFKRSVQVSAAIPTGSMGDIVFLLLIFFMATTIFKMEEGLRITLPRAESGIRVPRENTTHIWVNQAFEITIDDAYLTLDQMEQVLVQKIRETPQLLVGVNIDSSLPYKQVDVVLRAMRRVNALNVSFTSMLETPGE
jgi:biopolymer transport protein ExbD